jgi:hypothetical protein
MEEGSQRNLDQPQLGSLGVPKLLVFTDGQVSPPKILYFNAGLIAERWGQLKGFHWKGGREGRRKKGKC